MLTRDEAINLLKSGCECMHVTVNTNAVCRSCAYRVIELLKQKSEQPRRKPINASLSVMDNITEIISTCDDGAQFYLKIDGWSGGIIHTGKWTKLPPIPQDDEVKE